VNELATRIIEITPQGLRDFSGSYDEYLERAGGEDHLDAQEVQRRVRKSKREDRGERVAAKSGKRSKAAKR
jgi:ATPase subunit of ABC transporter with duplicated ATPase domains